MINYLIRRFGLVDLLYLYELTAKLAAHFIRKIIRPHSSEIIDYSNIIRPMAKDMSVADIL